MTAKKSSKTDPCAHFIALGRLTEDGFMVTDWEHRIIDANEIYLRQANRSLDELRALRLEDLTPAELQESLQLNLDESARKGFGRFEFIQQRESSPPLRFEASAFFIHAQGGRFCIFMRDLTEFRRIADTLRNLSRALQQIPSTVVITDTSGIIQYANPKFSALTGYTLEEVTGMPTNILKSGELPTSEYRNLWDTIQRGEEWHGEFHNRKKNGELYWEAASVSAIRNPAGATEHYLKVAEDITARKKAEQERDELLDQLQTLAIRDPLTGLYNRRGLEEEMERAWNLVRRHGQPLGIAVIDLDHFKPINDSHGHAKGDAILRESADLIRKTSRSSDILARYGGDEMIVVLPVTSASDTRAFGERLIEAFRRHTFCASSIPIKATISIGTANSMDRPMLEKSADEILIRADQALYEAKRSGRNRLCCWAGTGPVQTAHTADETHDGTSILVPPPSRPEILVVDDQREIGALIQRLLARSYSVTIATNKAEATQAFKQKRDRFDLVMVDLVLGKDNGLELLEELHRENSSTVFVVITGFASVTNAVEAMRRGAFDFLEKPLDRDLMIAVIERALKFRRLLRENQRYQRHLEEMVRDKSFALSAALDQVKYSFRFTLESLAAMMDAREHATGEHSIRVARVSGVLAREMGLSPTEIEHVINGALLHDIGKIAVPDSILLKPGPLTDEEWKIIKTHPAVGHNILRSNPSFSLVAEIVYSHQERYDGRGYPRGLKGSEICLGARIFAVVDAYDAMRSTRAYSQSRDTQVVIEEIRKNTNTQFDPEVVEALIRCLDAIEAAGEWSSGASA